MKKRHGTSEIEGHHRKVDKRETNQKLYADWNKYRNNNHMSHVRQLF
jgi:hypothetical protein